MMKQTRKVKLLKDELHFRQDHIRQMLFFTRIQKTGIEHEKKQIQIIAKQLRELQAKP